MRRSYPDAIENPIDPPTMSGTEVRLTMGGEVKAGVSGSGAMVRKFIPLETLSDVPMASPSYAIEGEEGAIYLPVLYALNPGHGEGGRFLDSLPTDRTIKVPGVISAVLAGMLERRGYVIEHEWAPELEERVEVYVRPASGYSRADLDRARQHGSAQNRRGKARRS